MNSSTSSSVDVVVVGAGMAGLYMLYALRSAGFTATVLESADDVGGTWYWNRYPGARCDVPSLDYQYSFDPALEAEWQWTEKYATQPEILRYLQHVAERYDLRRSIQFNTTVKRAYWDESEQQWIIHTEQGDAIRCRFYVMATGCLSMPKPLDIPGAEQFQGEIYSTARWPRHAVDFTGKRVAVIGTGSSGIQCIPIIAEQAKQLVVFQRTPNYSIPAGNGPIPESKRAAIAADRAAYRRSARYSSGGVPLKLSRDSAMAVSAEERERRYELLWAKGELFAPQEAFKDLMLNPESNKTYADFVRKKIREKVKDSHTAELLCPTTYPIGSKRPCLDSGYFETFNLPTVRLVDLHSTPIKRITANGIDCGEENVLLETEFDMIVCATGFDAMTGALVAVDIKGINGLTLKQKWEEKPTAYLGLTTAGFPNLFMINGPGSPSVFSNIAVSIEQHVEWITRCLVDMRERGCTQIEATVEAEERWAEEVSRNANRTLIPLADSWFVGANVPGKPRVFLAYLGGVGHYRETCDSVIEKNYLGFQLSGPSIIQPRHG